MTKSLISGVRRRRAAVAVVSIAAAGAFAVPGVAWAQNAIPSGEPTAVASPDAVVTPAAEVAQGIEVTQGVDGQGCSVKPLSDEEIQKLIADGKISFSTPVDGAVEKVAEPAEAKVLSDEEVQKLIADGTISAMTPSDGGFVVATPSTEAKVLSDEEVQKLIADGKISAGENIATSVSC